MDKTIVELFAGVGGFRLGLEKVPGWKTVWANQWEPSTTKQHAYDIYIRHFGKENVSNEDINLVDKKTIPDHTLLVGGFPCQDYSVARTKAEGIQGKKGVLWWSILDVIKAKNPPFILLENVDRLIKSPASQRGRDFGVMLRTLDDLGYSLEWRVINAADYGFVQRRRRVFMFGAHKSTAYYKALKKQDIEVGKTLTTQALLISDIDGKETKVGAPFVEGSKVECKVLEQKKGEKVRVFKMKSKKRFKRNKGFRPSITQLEIMSIS